MSPQAQRPKALDKDLDKLVNNAWDAGWHCERRKQQLHLLLSARWRPRGSRKEHPEQQPVHQKPCANSSDEPGWTFRPERVLGRA